MKQLNHYLIPQSQPLSGPLDPNLLRKIPIEVLKAPRNAHHNLYKKACLFPYSVVIRADPQLPTAACSEAARPRVIQGGYSSISEDGR